MRLAYAAVANIAQAVAHVGRFVPLGDTKLARSLVARHGLVERMGARARALRDPARSLVWLHAPSVGEGLQARPIAQALRDQHPSWQLAYTFYSPSAEAFASTVGADVADYLPFDRAADADALLDALRPSILVFAKLDVWPILVERAAARGVPVALISGTLAAKSGRRGWWSRLLVRDAYAALAAVGAVDVEHGERLIALGVARSAVRVTGDTRFDQVWERAQTVDRSAPRLLRLTSLRPTLVAGSTWLSDETVVLPAWTQWRETTPTARLIIAPHEPSPAHCARIEAWARIDGLRVARCSHLVPHDEMDDPDVILVDQVGMLGDLYALADMAFVGGGFHHAGLHSVIEPAAFGVPVAFGPRHTMSREAGLLLSAGGAHVVSDADALSTLLRVWSADDARRRFEGAAARTVVERERGATERSVRLIEQVLLLNSARAP